MPHVEEQNGAISVRSYEDAKKLVKTPDYSPWFSARNSKIWFWLNSMSSERTRQEKQNGANFSFLAPSSEELHVVHVQIPMHGHTVL